MTHTLEVICAADAIPEAINVDVADLEINHSRHLRDIKLPPGVRPLVDESATIVTVVPPSGYAEELKAAADAAAAAAAAAAPLRPQPVQRPVPLRPVVLHPQVAESKNAA